MFLHALHAFIFSVDSPEIFTPSFFYLHSTLGENITAYLLAKTLYLVAPKNCNFFRKAIDRTYYSSNSFTFTP